MLNLVVVVFLAWSSVSSALVYEEAEKIITKHVGSGPFKGPAKTGLCELNKCCNITATETCSISQFSKDESVLVLPGGQTRCIFSDSTPFAFQVRLEKLNLHLSTCYCRSPFFL